MRVCELRELVGSDISTVSKHLSVMKQAGTVDDRKVGRQVYCSLPCPCIRSFFGCVEAVMILMPSSAHQELPAASCERKT